MPNVTIGNTSKRINSTSQSFSGTTLSCKLKTPCSMQSPVFRVQGLTKGNIYNYASFEGRYYWIDDIIYITNNIQEVHCHLDPLATFKTAIGNTKAFIKYGDSSNWQRKIDDPRMQPEVQPTYLAPLISSVDAFHDDVTFTRDNGTVIMRVMAIPDAAGNQTVGIHTYAMTMSQFRECLADLSQIAINWSQAITPTMTFNEVCGEIMEFFAKIWSALGGSGSWVDNIFSCIYVPVDISAFQAHHIGSPWSSFYIGNIVCDSFTGSVYEIETSGVFLNVGRTISIPWSTQATTYPYLKNPRWNALQCILPGNYMEIDTTDLKDQTELGWYSCINLTTGHWSGKIVEARGDTNEVLASAQGSIAIDLMGMIGTGATSGSVGWNGLSKVLSAASMGRMPAITTQAVSAEKAGQLSEDEAMYGGAPDRMVEVAKVDAMGVASGIAGTFLDTGMPVGCAGGSIGANGTELFLVEPATTTALGKLILRYIQYMPVCNQRYEDYCDEYGYPFNDFGAINAHSGYVCCVGASVKNATGATEANKSTINSYLNSGFYYE